MGDILKQPTSRHILTESVALSSTVGNSTAVFASGCFQIRIAASQDVRFVVSEAPSVSSTVLLTGGAMVPAGQIDYVTVTPGQRLSATTTSTAATITVTQLG
jgi:hypothetical protein